MYDIFLVYFAMLLLSDITQRAITGWPSWIMNCVDWHSKCSLLI